MYEPAMVNALRPARFGSGFSKPNSNFIMKSTHRVWSLLIALTTVATVSAGMSLMDLPETRELVLLAAPLRKMSSLGSRYVP